MILHHVGTFLIGVMGAANRDKNEGQGKNATQRPPPHVYFHDFFLRRFQIQKIPDWLLGVKRCFD